MSRRPKESQRPLVGLSLATAGLALAFCVPLFRLVRLAFASELYSYLLVVPLISAGLVWLRRNDLPPPSPPHRGLALSLGLAGGAVAALAWADPGQPDWAILSFLLLFAAACAWFLGRRTLRALAFPLGFLVCLIPLPPPVADQLTAASQHASAAIAFVLFQVAGIPVLQHGDLSLQLPDISLEVAPQCAGLHSSLALLITSLPAGYLLLQSPWRRATLSLAVIPIALLRNGFRIFTIGALCVRLGPDFINSYLHRHGGWIFFLLSLALLLGLLAVLARSERVERGDPTALSGVAGRISAVRSPRSTS